MILQSILTPIEQIQAHDDQALRMYTMHIMNAVPSSLDSQLVGGMISISFQHDYTVVFTKKRFPKGFFFNVRKIISVESSISNKCATIEVD
jgi:hypothetical protein